MMGLVLKQRSSCNILFRQLQELRHDILSYFFDGLNCGSSVGKPKNDGLLRKKNTKDLILKQKGTRMAEDGED